MKYENEAVKRNILSSLKNDYHFDLNSITFIPVGEESYCYAVTDKQKDKFFVKYCEKPLIIKNIDVVNQLLAELSNFNFVVAPIQINGQTSFDILQGKIYVYPYIEGQVMNVPNEQFDPGLVSDLLNVVVKIHSASVTADLPKETFDNNFLAGLEEVKLQIHDKDTQKLMEENEPLVRKLIEQHTILGEKYKQSKPDFVLTHGDITGLNIIKTSLGIKLTDWDGAMFAPAERDLNFLYDIPHFSIDEYLRLMHKNKIDPELREYYGQQWSLDSIIDNFRKLTNSKITKEEKTESIEEIEQYTGYYK